MTIFFATSVVSATVPWSKGLGVLTGSITGPVAGLIVVIAIVAACATWMFRHDIGEFFSHLSGKALAMGGAATAGAMALALFGVTGACI